MQWYEYKVTAFPSKKDDLWSSLQPKPQFSSHLNVSQYI